MALLASLSGILVFFGLYFVATYIKDATKSITDAVDRANETADANARLLRDTIEASTKLLLQTGSVASTQKAAAEAGE